jgi:hypothetical protein
MPAIAMGLFLPDQHSSDRTDVALRRCLWSCLLCQVGALEAAALAGTNLLTARYFLSIVVPGVLLAATAVARVPRLAAAVAVLAFAVITGQGLVMTKLASGTFSGVGDEGWRAAVTDLSARLRNEPQPLVFYRAGFVEEDVLPLGSPPAATLAPLRSPGAAPFAAPVKSLTFRWNRAARQEYFERTIAPDIRSASRFFVLSRQWTPEGVSYPEEFAGWIAGNWPATFEVARQRFGGVELLEFRRRVR